MIDHCPKCNYALAGLPDQYRCPECGVDYDREAVAFSDPKRVAITGLIVSGTWLLFFGTLYWKSGDHRFAILLVALLLLIAWFTWLICRQVHTHAIYVAPRLIQVVRKGSVQRIDTQSVATVQGDIFDGYIYLYDSDGIEIGKIGTRSMFRVRKIAAQIRAFASDGKPGPAKRDQVPSS